MKGMGVTTPSVMSTQMKLLVVGEKNGILYESIRREFKPFRKAFAILCVGGYMHVNISGKSAIFSYLKSMKEGGV